VHLVFKDVVGGGILPASSAHAATNHHCTETIKQVVKLWNYSRGKYNRRPNPNLAGDKWLKRH
jgi:hypothetical protein